MATHIPTPLNTAFYKACYTVFTRGASFTLHIGHYSEPLAGLMEKHQASTMGILTAYNPGGAITDPEINLNAQRLLLNHIQQLGLPYIKGENSSPDGHGHVEPTVVVLGIRLEQAYALAQQFGQCAFVYANCCAMPELIWTRS